MMMSVGAAGALLSAAREPPNVLILFADDLGAGDLQVYGHPTTKTPHLDALASSGIRFTQWYSGFHVCSPSRASMMTGRLPIRSGLAGGSWTGGVLGASAKGGLPHNETTVAEALGSVGFATMAIGKWHLGQQPEFLPTAHGFDEYYGIPYSDDMGGSAWKHYTSPYLPPLPLLHSTGKGQVTIVEQPTDLNFLSDRYVSAAKSFIANQTSAARNWLLYYAFSHVHTPDFASRHFCNSTLRGRFGDALYELDDAVGDVMAAVREAGALKSTIVFFSSDNGPWLIRGLSGGSAGLLRDGKQTTWEGGVREPGLISWPGVIPGGRISPAVVATYDIFATVLKLARVPLPSDRAIDGKDLSDILFNGNETSPHECIYHWKGAPGLNCPKAHPACPGLWAVRCGAYKLHWVTMDSIGEHKFSPVFHNPPLIFQLEHDPSEAYPIAANSSEYVQARRMIEAAAATHKASVLPVPNQAGLGMDSKLKVCCDPNSKSKYPLLPECTCDPDNWHAFVCSPVGPTTTRDSMSGRVSVAHLHPGSTDAMFDPRNDSTWPMEEDAIASLVFMDHGGVLLQDA